MRTFFVVGLFVVVASTARSQTGTFSGTVARDSVGAAVGGAQLQIPQWNVEYSGIEFYSGGATIPAQYNATGSGCGVMLLWTRRTP